MTKKTTKKKTNKKQNANQKPTTKQVKSRFFQSIKLNKDKYENLVRYATLNKEIKNFLSLYIYTSDNLRERILLREFSKNELEKLTRVYRKDFVNKDTNGNDFCISASCFKNSCKAVMTTYSNQLDGITYTNFDKYPATAKYMAFLVKHYKPGKEFFFYIKSRMNKKEPNFYNGLMNFIIELNKRKIFKPIIKKMIEIRKEEISRLKLIEFKSLTFQDLNVLTDNPSKGISGKSLTLNNSLKKGNCIFTLNLAAFCQIPIIVKYSRKYHGILSTYDGTLQESIRNGFRRYITYSIQFLNDRKVRIIFFPAEDTEKYKFNKNFENILGVDVNTSDNLFSLSDNKQIFYDEKFINQAIRLEKHVTRKQKNKENDGADTKKYSKTTQRRIDKMTRRSKFQADKKASELIKYMKENNYDTLVCEDMNIQGLKTDTKKDGKINCNKLASYLHLNDYKNVFERLCKKNNINFVKVNPAFTSKQCPWCGHIHEDNRNSRKFLCKKCGHVDNADINAAINIRNRFSNEYLRDNLLLFDKDKQIYTGTKHRKATFYEKTYQDMLVLKNTISNKVNSSKKNKKKK